MITDHPDIKYRKYIYLCKCSIGDAHRTQSKILSHSLHTKTDPNGINKEAIVVASTALQLGPKFLPLDICKCVSLGDRVGENSRVLNSQIYSNNDSTVHCTGPDLQTIT